MALRGEIVVVKGKKWLVTSLYYPTEVLAESK